MEIATPQKQGLNKAFTDNQWKPGQSGNPGGKPKGESITAKLRKVLDQPYTPDGKTVADHIVDTIVNEILKGKNGFNTPLLKELLDRVEGKVVETRASVNKVIVQFEYHDRSKDKSDDTSLITEKTGEFSSK